MPTFRFNSTLVRFKPEEKKRKKKNKITVSIPLWFDSNSIPSNMLSIVPIVSIPLWFDSNDPCSAYFHSHDLFQFHSGSIQTLPHGS